MQRVVKFVGVVGVLAQQQALRDAPLRCALLSLAAMCSSGPSNSLDGERDVPRRERQKRHHLLRR